MRSRWAAVGLLLAAAILCGPSFAGTLYKLIDKDGRVTCSDQPPQDFAGRIVPVQVGPAPEPGQRALSPPAETEYEKIIQRKPPARDDSEVVAAKRRLEEARQALEQARESASPDDWIYTGNRGPGPRRYARPEYLERLARLEADVRAAEEKLAEAERKWVRQ